jgi:hypothetical protein
MPAPFVVDVGAFQAAFPTFRTTDPLFIAATMARASRMHDSTVWGAQWADGIWLLTAHWLTIDPFGTNTALKPDARSTYGDQWELMKRTVVGGGFGVASCIGGGGGGGYPP